MFVVVYMLMMMMMVVMMKLAPAVKSKPGEEGRWALARRMRAISEIGQANPSKLIVGFLAK